MYGLPQQTHKNKIKYKIRKQQHFLFFWPTQWAFVGRIFLIFSVCASF